ncbi:MAG: hypothetical protein ACLFQK_01590 [Fibrobacterota bacterium]
MPFRVLKNLMIDGSPEIVEIQLGDHVIGDKAYVRIGKSTERWFNPSETSREGVIKESMEFMKEILKGKNVNYEDGRPFDWQ